MFAVVKPMIQFEWQVWVGKWYLIYNNHKSWYRRVRLKSRITIAIDKAQSVEISLFFNKRNININRIQSLAKEYIL